jgi:hypothetical protein
MHPPVIIVLHELADFVVQLELYLKVVYGRIRKGGVSW